MFFPLMKLLDHQHKHCRGHAKKDNVQAVRQLVHDSISRVPLQIAAPTDLDCRAIRFGSGV